MIESSVFSVRASVAVSDSDWRARCIGPPWQAMAVLVCFFCLAQHAPGMVARGDHTSGDVFAKARECLGKAILSPNERTRFAVIDGAFRCQVPALALPMLRKLRRDKVKGIALAAEQAWLFYQNPKALDQFYSVNGLCNGRYSLFPWGVLQNAPWLVHTGRSVGSTDGWSVERRAVQLVQLPQGFVPDIISALIRSAQRPGVAGHVCRMRLALEARAHPDQLGYWSKLSPNLQSQILSSWSASYVIRYPKSSVVKYHMWQWRSCLLDAGDPALRQAAAQAWIGASFVKTDRWAKSRIQHAFLNETSAQVKVLLAIAVLCMGESDPSHGCHWNLFDVLDPQALYLMATAHDMATMFGADAITMEHLIAAFLADRKRRGAVLDLSGLPQNVATRADKLASAWLARTNDIWDSPWTGKNSMPASGSLIRLVLACSVPLDLAANMEEEERASPADLWQALLQKYSSKPMDDPNL